jgi:phosphoribosylanthranilate isomerase
MCGMTRMEDIVKASLLGVDAIGLIFYSGSSRGISIEKARLLLRHQPLFMDIVAVMVNPTVSHVNQIITELPVQWLQFHGEESPGFCAQFNKPYIKAISAASTELINKTIELHRQASAILLDTPSLAQRGGTGEVFNWGVIPPQRDTPIVLAGGLEAGNVSRAVGEANVNAVDVCSGIEESPGIKNHNKMVQFVNALRGRENER